ncbi:RNA-directed DNA polymerase, eukaryota [Tanacetum coccineum]
MPSFGRKRVCILTKSPISILESFKIIVRGKIFMVRAKELFIWNPNFLAIKEELCTSDDDSVQGEKSYVKQSFLSEEEEGEFNASEVEGVAETIFDDTSSSPKLNSGNSGHKHSEGPFELYDLLSKKKNVVEACVSSPSLSHPPGFTPVGFESENNKVQGKGDINGDSDKMNLLSINVQGLGNKTKKEWIKELTIKNKLKLIAIQETKMDKISHMDVKFMWGNPNYDFVCSDSLGNSGGILCIWEASVFKKDYVSISDNFVAIYGTWLPSNVKFLFVVIYAPQQPALKRVLWEYISLLLSRWNGKAILIGDFNEVRSSDERRGSWFNQASARVFNHFISSSGLVDIKLEVTDGVVSLFPSITALCLDRHLSDHRLILLRDIPTDFGPIPFRFFHSWFKYEGFDEMVEQTWRSFSHSDRNGMVCFKKKLQDLKAIIRQWIKDKRIQMNDSKQVIKDGLCEIDKKLDQGLVSDSLLARRRDLNRQLDVIKSKEDANSFQKSKIRWAIEGDENLIFFHGIINKKRSQLAIRGVFVDGVWQTDPCAVKVTFRKHFEARFKKPTSSGLKINFTFPKRLVQDQAGDLERSKYWSFIGRGRTILYEWSFFKGVQLFFHRSNSKGLGLVNGSPSNEFLFHGGLKQGDPLAPYLFILVMESLHLSFSRVVDAGMFKGIRLSNSLSLSHLFYADDALIIGEWSNDNLRSIINVLKCFHLASGLQINIHKSQLLGVGVPRVDVETTASSIGCSIMNDQFRYLGVMVGENMSRHKAWADVVLKLRSRLSKWKSKTLSIGGFLKEMESIRNNFFIGADSLDKKITWVAWNNVLASKKNGGLGVSSFYALNQAMFLKWVWRFISEDGSLWSRVIQAVYGSHIGSHSVHMASTWSSIMREVQLLKSKGFDFMSLCSKRVGDGSNTRFWLDVWKGDSPFCDVFPGIFALEQDKQMTVANKMAAHVSASFRRPVRGGIEQQQLSDLVTCMDSVSHIITP